MRRSLLLFVFIISCVISYAQTIRNCATMEQDAINRLKYPKMGTLSDFEIAVRKKIVELDALRKAGRTQATTITIPIVVHVVHLGEPVGTGLNLSQAQVQAQIDVLMKTIARKPEHQASIRILLAPI